MLHAARAASQVEFKDVKDIFSNPFQLHAHGDASVTIAVFIYALLRLGSTMVPGCDNGGNAPESADASGDGSGERAGEQDLDAGACEFVLAGAYHDHLAIEYTIDLMLVVLCLAVAFTRAGYKEYLERGKKGAKSASSLKKKDSDPDAKKKGSCSGEGQYHSLRWWLYNTCKSQDFRESIETCFGTALNIIDLQGIEPQSQEIHNWILVVIFLQLVFVLGGENLVLFVQLMWRKCAARWNSKQALMKQTQFESFEDSDFYATLEMIFVHLSTFTLRCFLPFTEDSVNGVFVLYSFISMLPLFVKAGVESIKYGKKCFCCMWDSDDDTASGKKDDDKKLVPLKDAIRDTFNCNYMTPEFHFESEFDIADIDDSMGLNKAEFVKFVALATGTDEHKQEAMDMFERVAQSVTERAMHAGDHWVLHQRCGIDNPNTGEEFEWLLKIMPSMVRNKEEQLKRRRTSFVAPDNLGTTGAILDEHASLEAMEQTVTIITRQDILIGCVKFFAPESRDWLYLGAARTLVQFVKRGKVHIKDHDDIMGLSEDDKTYRVMAAIDLCNEVLSRHDNRLAGTFCGKEDDKGLDSMKKMQEKFQDPQMPTPAELFAYRTEAVAIMKANLYKAAALSSDQITPEKLKEVYRKKYGSEDAEKKFPWFKNLFRAWVVLETLKDKKKWDRDGDGATDSIDEWFEHETKQYCGSDMKNVIETFKTQDRKRVESVTSSPTAGTLPKGMRLSRRFDDGTAGAATAINPSFDPKRASSASSQEFALHHDALAASAKKREADDAQRRAEFEASKAAKAEAERRQKEAAEQRLQKEREAEAQRAQQEEAEAQRAQQEEAARQAAEPERLARFKQAATHVGMLNYFVENPQFQQLPGGLVKGNLYQKVGDAAVNTGWITLKDDTGAVGEVHPSYAADFVNGKVWVGKEGIKPYPGQPDADPARSQLAVSPGEYFQQVREVPASTWIEMKTMVRCPAPATGHQPQQGIVDKGFVVEFDPTASSA